MPGGSHDEECAEVLIDGLPDSPASSASQHVPSLRDASFPVTPHHSDNNANDDGEGGCGARPYEAPSDEVPPVRDAEGTAADVIAPAQIDKPPVTRRAPTSGLHSTGPHGAQEPKKRTSRLYTPPPTAGTPNYGRVLNFSEEEEMEKKRAQKRRSVTRGDSAVPAHRENSDRAQTHRHSRLEDSVPRGPAPNYGTVLRFNDEDKREAPQRSKAQSKPSSLNATTNSTAPTKPSAEERARRLEQLSRPRQPVACETTPPPNLTKARKVPAYSTSLSHLNALATPRKRELRPEEDVISTPRHVHRPGGAAPVNHEALNRLSQPRQPRASVSRDPYLSQAREQARAPTYGGTTPISLPSKEPAARGTSVDRRQSNDRANSVSWDDMKPAPRPTHSLVKRPSTPASPRGLRKTAGAPPAGTPPLAKPAPTPSTSKAPHPAKLPAEHVVPSQPAPSAITVTSVAGARGTSAPAEEAMPKPPMAVRAKRRADPEAASWQPLGTGSAPAAPTAQSTAVVYAAKRKTQSVTPLPPSSPTLPPPTTQAASKPVVVVAPAVSPAPTSQAAGPMKVMKPVPVHVAIKKRPPPKAAAVHSDPSNRDVV